MSKKKKVEQLRKNLQKATCGNCMFCKIVHESGYIGDYRDSSDYTWECRYNPPQITGGYQYRFPNVACNTGWCGHFIPAQELKDKE